MSEECVSNHPDNKCELIDRCDVGINHGCTTNRVLNRSQKKTTWKIALRLCGMYLGMASIGMAHSLLGSILLEIQMQTGADIDKLALLFTWSSFGRLLSSFVIGFVFDRLHPEMQLGIFALLAALCSITIPLSRMYAVVALAITMQGFCIGFISTGSSVNTFNMVSESNLIAGPFVQTTYFAFAVGCVLGPFVAEPFLTELKQCGHEQHFANETNIDCNKTMTTIQNNTNSSGEILRYTHTGSFYPNVILALCFCFPIIIFSTQFVMDQCKVKRPTRRTHITNDIATSKVVLILFMIAFFCSIGVEVSYMGLVYTYTVKVHKWLPKTANYLLTVYWTTFAVCRAVSIPLSRLVKPHQMLAISIVTMVATLTLLVSANHVTHVILWITSAGMGMATSIQMGTLFLLGNQYMPVTGRVAGYFTTSIYVGCIVIPAMSGFIFIYVDLTWFPSILLIFSILLLVDFIAIRCIGKMYSNN